MYLKQSTAVTIVLGPFLDSADGVTPETGLTISQADVRLSKNGGSFAQKNDTGSCTHMENGNYSCALNTTDTGTVGVLRVHVNESGALPVWRDFMVLTADAYDALVNNSGNGIRGNVQAIAASVITATSIATDAITAAKIASGAITAAKFAASAIDAAALATDAAAEIADSILGRSLQGGADGGRTVRDALRSLRNRWNNSAGTLTVYEEDDTTPAWTGSVTQTAGDPVSQVDPA
jgi:hypothetical protein